MKQTSSKRIVINNAKKSMIINPPTNNDLKYSMTSPKNNPQPQNKNLSNSFGPESVFDQKQKEYQEKIKKLTEEQAYYKSKCDQSLIKVRFLTQKLESYGGLTTLPENISKEISQTDKRIKQLEELLYFKRSKQMKKLKKRIRKFLEVLEYEISDEDLNNIDDEVEIILFLIDVFSDKYNELTAEKNQIDNLVDSLKDDTVFNRKAMQEELEYSRIEKQRLNRYLRDLEMQLVEFRRGNKPSTLRYQTDELGANKTRFSSNDQIHDLQRQKQSLKVELEKQRNKGRSLQYQITMLKRRTQQNQSTIISYKTKIMGLKQQLENSENQQNKWRQRYNIMERQKDQHIRLLENQKYQESQHQKLHTDQSYGRISFGKGDRDNRDRQGDKDRNKEEQEYFDLT